MNLHVPVLKTEVLELLKPTKGENYLDLTTGYGGHAQAVLERTGNYQHSVLVDRDQFAIDHIKELFEPSGAIIRRQNFLEACDQLIGEEKKFDLILAELGVSSPHLDIASRGFSFMADGPLDMRMDQSAPLSASEIVNSYDEEALAKIIKQYGEEPAAKRVAKLIVQHRPYKSTLELARTLESTLGWRRKGVHPATRVFQGIRIAVNDELNLLTAMLPKAMQLLSPGGRFGVITFHSLEDREVKRTFNEAAGGGYDASFLSLTKKPITPTAEELVNNPRSRSAKLRGVAKIKK